MKGERRKQIEQLYHSALELEESQRATYLKAACAGDEELRREVESLLAHGQEADTLPEAPALDTAAEMSGEGQAGSLIGQQLDHYKILSFIGAGGMGEVYRAFDLRLRRYVALKTLPPEMSADKERLSRFEKEARLASSLNHPNIITIYGIGQVGSSPYIAMEFVDGKTLRQVLAFGRLPPERAVDVAAQVADGLAAAHTVPIVHRDLKPENLMIRNDGLVKILDFGLGKVGAVFEYGSSLPTAIGTPTSPGKILGTVDYMSPEQASGKEADFRSDQFSVGSVLYEMVTGKCPFRRETAVQTLSAIIENEPEPVTRLNPEVPEPLQRIVERCLAKEPEKRYTSTQDLSRELRRLRDHSRRTEGVPGLEYQWTTLAPAARPVPATSRWKVWTSSKLALIVACLVLLALSLFVLNPLSWWQRTPGADSETQRPVVAVLPFSNTSGDPANEHLGVGIAEVLITNMTSLSGISVVSLSETLKYRESPRNLKQVSRDLGATLIVDGGVQRSGNHLRVTVNLIRGDSNVVTWSHEFDAEVTNVFSLQRELADELIEVLRVTSKSAIRTRASTAPTSNLEAFADYSQGKAFLDRPDVLENLERAEQLFKSAVQKDPKFGLAHAGLAQLYWARFSRTKESSWTTKARESCMEALRLDPDQAAVRIALAVIYRGTGRTEDAIQELRRAIVSQPSNDEAHRTLGSILAEQGNLTDALLEFDKATDSRPGFWGNYQALGLAYYHAGRFQEAVATFRRITELQPDNALGFQELGATYHVIGDTKEALSNYGHANRLTPTASVYTNIGTIHYEQGRYDRALQAYQQAVGLMPKNPIYYRNIGDTFQRLGDQKKAREYYLQAVELTQEIVKVNPKNARTLSQLAVYEAKAGRQREAQQHATEAVARSPTDMEVLYRKTVVHSLAGQASEALAALKLALDAGFSADVARKDDDLALIKGLAEFKSLIGTRR